MQAPLSDKPLSLGAPRSRFSCTPRRRGELVPLSQSGAGAASGRPHVEFGPAHGPQVAKVLGPLVGETVAVGLVVDDRILGQKSKLDSARLISLRSANSAIGVRGLVMVSPTPMTRSSQPEAWFSSRPRR